MCTQTGGVFSVALVIAKVGFSPWLLLTHSDPVEFPQYGMFYLYPLVVCNGLMRMSRSCVQVRQLCEIEAALEEAAFIVSVAREHLADKPYIPPSVLAAESPLYELAHWSTFAGSLQEFLGQVRYKQPLILPLNHTLTLIVRLSA